MQNNPSKVFISYAYDTYDFSDKVLYFSNYLREQGIDANIDLYEESPSQGWQRWMQEEIENSDFVIIICTDCYYKKIINYSEGEGKGVNWECNIVYQSLYDTCCNNTKFIPVVFNDYFTNKILAPLKSSTIYYPDKANDMRKLCNRLKGIKNIKKPPLGQSTENNPLPTKQRKQLFITSTINVKLWDDAKWCGTSYLFDEEHKLPPVLMLTFVNETYCKKIFAEWEKSIENGFLDSVDITIIETTKQTKPNGYYAFICTNSNYIKTMFKENETYFLLDINRFQHMDVNRVSTNLIRFKDEYKKFDICYIMPAWMKDGKRRNDLSNIEFDNKLMMKFRNISYKDITELSEQDREYIVTEHPNNKLL